MNVRPANSGDIYYLQDCNICVDWHSLLKDTHYQIYILSPMFKYGLLGYAICHIGHSYIIEEISTKSPKLVEFLIGQANIYGKRPVFKVDLNHVYIQEILKSRGFVAFKETNTKLLMGH